MDCPTCTGTLHPAEAGDLTLDRCDRCGGAWFEVAALDNLDEGAVRELRSATAPDAAVELRGTEACCPVCSGTLIGVTDLGGSGARLQGCVICYGRWVPGDEIGRLGPRPLAGRVGALARRMFLFSF